MIEEKYNNLCTQLALHSTNNSVEIVYISDITLRYTFDNSTVKID